MQLFTLCALAHLGLAAAGSGVASLRGRAHEGHERRLSIVETVLVEDGSTGSWQAEVLGDGGYYACGASVQVDGDSLLVDGLKLTFCSLVDWARQSTATVYTGMSGSFGAFTMCPTGSFLYGMDVRSDRTKDIGYSALIMRCRNPATNALAAMTLHNSVGQPDLCNPGTFQGVRWTCRGNHALPTGNRCDRWERCQPGANPGSFDNKQWICPADRDLETGNRCENRGTNWVEYNTWKNNQVWHQGQHATKYLKGAQAHGSNTKSYLGGFNGLRLLVDTLHFGVSQQPVLGIWRNVGSGNLVELSLTESMELSTGTSVTREESFGFSQEISAGFEVEVFGFGVETEVSVGAEQAFTTSRSVESTLSRTQEVTFTVSCGNEPPQEGGRWFLYQWVMEQPRDSFGPGFGMSSRHTVCTNSFNKHPRCPLGYCMDSDCQNCETPFEYLSEPASEPSSLIVEGLLSQGSTVGPEDFPTTSLEG